MDIDGVAVIRIYILSDALDKAGVMPYTLVKDTRTGFESTNVNAVMDGDLDGFINAYLTCAATGTWATK